MKTNTLFYGGLVFSSLDSFPLFKSISTYGPYISVLLFALYYCFASDNIFRFKFSRSRFIILLFIVTSMIYSLFVGIGKYHDLSGFINYVIQLLIAVVLYKSFSCYFCKLKKNGYTISFSRLFIKASYLVLIVGIIELCLFPVKGVYSNFVALFSWRVTPERVQLLSGEPAWATRFLLTFIALLPLANFERKKLTILYSISAILLLATGSTLGLICVLIYFSFTYFNRKYLKYYIAGAAIVVLSAPVVYNNLNPYTQGRINVLMQLESSDLETIAVEAGSGSVMARLGNPVLAAYMGKDNILMGVGGGYYSFHHYDYLEKYFPKALQIKNVYETGITAKNLFARIFAETGLFGICLLIYALTWVYFRRVRHDNLLRGVFIAMILLTLNFDTLFHIYPLLLFTFLMHTPNIKHRINENLLLPK